MDVVNQLFFVFWLVGLPVMGAWFVLFNRRASVGGLWNTSRYLLR